MTGAPFSGKEAMRVTRSRTSHGRPPRGLGLAVAGALACLGGLGLGAPAWAAAPTASTVDVVELSADGARLRGSVNPGGEATKFWFEYGRTAGYGSAAPLAKNGSAGSGSDDLIVSQAIHGLESGVDYHFRIVAANASGTVEGADGVFTTRQPAAECPNAAIRRQQGSGFLPDCRAYEQVSPVDKQGQRLGGNSDRVVDLTLDPSGERVLYKGLFAIPPAQAPSTSAMLASRGGDGWSNFGLFPAPGPVSLGLGFPALSMVLRASTDDQRTIAYWDNTTAPHGSLNVRRADGSIVRIADGNALGGVFGASAGQAWAFVFSPDGKRLYFSSNRRLGPAVGLPGVADILYEWSDDGAAGALRVVNRTNDPAMTLLSTSAASLGGSTPNVNGRTAGTRGLRNAVSDGSDGHDRVFFQTPAPTSDTTATGGPIYMREDGERTVEISAPEGANLPATQRRYLDASEDGSKVFFWAGSQLTDDATPGPGIYRYDVDVDGSGDLVFIAAADPLGGAPPTALASPDGENLLFTGGSETRISVSGTVSTPLPITGMVVGGSFSATGVTGTPGIRDDRCPTASVTPDGRYFVFVAGSAIATKIYRLDTASGQVLALSDPPAVPVGPELPGLEAASLFVSECSTSGAPRTFESKLVSDDGRRVFFTSLNSLTSDDTSALRDVYEWFDDGTASGRLSLLTKPGASSGSGSFLGVDGSGEAAFFISSLDPQIPSDGDRDPDIYAVRVGGGFAAEKPRRCAGDGCQGRTAGRPDLAAAAGDVGGAGDRHATARARESLFVGLSATQRARFANGQRAVLRVRVGRPGVIRVVGRAQVAGSRTVVVRGRRRVQGAGVVAIGLRLSSQARKAAARSRLRVGLSVRFGGSTAKRLTLTAGGKK